jgi:YbbR domain-containing protein
LGVLLWLTISGHQITRSLRIDLSFRNLPAQFEMVSDSDPVRVMVRGDDSVVSSLTPGGLRLIVDLSHAHEGTNLYPLSTEDVIAPPNVEVLMVDPGAVTVQLEASGRREVVITPTIDGTPAAGFVRGSVTVDPRSITVVGPERRLARGVTVVTERISIEGLSRTLTETVDVVVVDAQVRPLESRRVKVVVPIVPGNTR